MHSGTNSFTLPPMTNSLALRIAAFFGFLAVALGAFGAHSLRDILVRNGTVSIWDKAVLYHAIHTVMLFVLATQTPLKKWSWFSFLIGIVVFSGSLYVLALSNARWLGAITPIGGISFLAGWACLAICPSKLRPNPSGGPNDPS